MADIKAKKNFCTKKTMLSELFSIELPQFIKDTTQKDGGGIQHQHALLLASHIELRTQVTKVYFNSTPLSV